MKIEITFNTVLAWNAHGSGYTESKDATISFNYTITGATTIKLPADAKVGSIITIRSTESAKGTTEGNG